MTGGYGALIDRLGLKCHARSFGAQWPTRQLRRLSRMPSDVKCTPADFAGVWETGLLQTGSATYRLTLAVTVGNAVTGTFINEENQTYNGTLTGTANGASPRLHTPSLRQAFRVAATSSSRPAAPFSGFWHRS